MRDFPFDNCPTASELRRYLRRATSGEIPWSSAEEIELHLANCSDCSDALKRLQAADDIAAGQPTNRSEGSATAALADAALDALLTSQRTRVGDMMAARSRTPQVGDVWTSRAAWTWGAKWGSGKSGFSALLVVLRTFVDDWTAAPLVDVAPVTDDERYAADWSLILSAEGSGMGTPIVAHLDIQCTAQPNALRRWVGRLSADAGQDMMTVLHAFARGEAVYELRVGLLGQAAVRAHPDWVEFAEQLLSVCAAVAAPFDEAIDESASVGADEHVKTAGAASERHDVPRCPVDPLFANRSRAGPEAGPPVAGPWVERQPFVRPTDASPLRTGTPTTPYAPPVAGRIGPANHVGVPRGGVGTAEGGSPHSAGGDAIRRLSEANVYVFRTLGDVLDWYLASRFQGDVRRWCLQNGRKGLTRDLFRPFDHIPAEEVLRATALPPVLQRIAGAPRLEVGALTLLAEATHHARGMRDLPGAQIGKRAARTKGS